MANPREFAALLAEETRLPDPVVARQLARTDLSSPRLGAVERELILQAGVALQAAGVIGPAADVRATVDALIDPHFAARG